MSLREKKSQSGFEPDTVLGDVEGNEKTQRKRMFSGEVKIFQKEVPGRGKGVVGSRKGRLLRSYPPGIKKDFVKILGGNFY